MISATKKRKPGKRREGGVVRKGPTSTPRTRDPLELVWDRPTLGTKKYWGGFLTNFLIHFWSHQLHMALFMTSLAEIVLKLCMFIESNLGVPSVAQRK